MKPHFNPNKTGSGELRIPVTFYQYEPDDSPFPSESELKPVYTCFAEAYNASMKDIEVLKGVNAKRSVTIKIRDSKGEYFPSTEHYAALQDYRYSSTMNGITKPIRFNIVDVRPDLKNNDFITILLAVIE